MSKFQGVLLLVFLAVAPPLWASAAKRPAPAQTKGLQMSSRELLVAFESQEAALGRAEIFAKHGVEEVEQVGSSPLYLVRTGETADFKATKEALAKEPGVRYAEANIQMRTFKGK
jgi:hypothetical protein